MNFAATLASRAMIKIRQLAVDHHLVALTSSQLVLSMLKVMTVKTQLSMAKSSVSNAVNPAVDHQVHHLAAKTNTTIVLKLQPLLDAMPWPLISLL